MLTSLLLAATNYASAASPSDEIVVTASRVPEERKATAASVEVIDEQEITRLGDPLVYQFLRLTPSLSVSTSGPAGKQTQVRIRGAEANHTLLFIDGIKANDLTFGDEARFELLNADLASRIEVVRGPQSALWGSQAIGGVVAVDGSSGDFTGYAVKGEAGSFGFGRASASGALSEENASLAAALGWQQATGIDVFGGGDRDGYCNLSGRALARWSVAPDIMIGVNGFLLNGSSQFDGYDPFTFLPSHDLSTRFGMTAGRVWSKFGSLSERFSASLSASLLRASNRNLFQGDETSRATGLRSTLSAQGQFGFTTGSAKHELVAAADYESERFKARDTVFGGLSNQDSNRRHGALTAEWKTNIGTVIGDVVLRRDIFSRFKDSTNLRASLVGRLGNGFSLAGSYGEGIAPPTFTELFGFFPGSFVGNPGLKPEKSRGFEASVRFDSESLRGALTAYQQNLHDEIITVFTPTFTSTAVNREGTSRRRGIEAEVGWQPIDVLRLSANYSYLRASEPNASGEQIREVRRPKHSGAIALDGMVRRLTYGVSLAYTGKRTDLNFDVFPSQTVRLGAYWLAGARVAYQVSPGIELFARGSNLLDQRSQDVFGYRTEGRAIFAGIRLAGR